MTEKKEKKIRGCDVGSLKVGQPAVIYSEEGQILKTSPVVSYIKAGGVVIIETKNTVYKTV